MLLNTAEQSKNTAHGTKSHHESLLFLHSLEATVTELGGGVDKLEVDLLQSTTAGLHQQGLDGGEQDSM